MANNTQSRTASDLARFLGVDLQDTAGGAGGLDPYLLRLIKQGEDPVPRFAFARRAAGAAVQMRRAVKKVEDEADELVQAALRRDWREILADDRDRAIERAVAPIEQVARRARRDLLADLESNALRMERDSRRAAKRKFRLDVPTVLTGALVLDAVRRAASAMGFVEGEYARRADAARDAARIAVRDAVAAGKSSRDASRAAAAAARGVIRNDDYWRDVSMATLNRSRSASLLTVYAEAGFSGYTVRAFPDACRKCQFMDGQTFTVKRGMEVLEKSSEARTPEDIRRASPFLGEGVDPSGRQAVFVGSGESRRAVAVVQGQGFTDAASAADLAQAGILLPPFHPRCQCVPVPA